jgi:hypothetical protein
MDEEQQKLLLAVLSSAKCIYEDKECYTPPPAYYDANQYPPPAPEISPIKIIDIQPGSIPPK